MFCLNVDALLYFHYSISKECIMKRGYEALNVVSE
jgi:hypothetical protein